LAPEEVDAALETIEQNTLRQSQLIGDIVDISRVDEGRLKIDPAPCRLEEVVEAALETIQRAAAAKSIDLEVSIAPTPSIVADATRLQQILWNLLSNAIKFTPDGGTVHLTVEAAEAHAKIVVADTGKGIS